MSEVTVEEYVSMEEAAEITALARQQREVSVELAKERARAAELEKQVARLTSELQYAHSSQPAAQPAPARARQAAPDPRLAQLVVENSKLQSTVGKLRTILTREMGEEELNAALQTGHLSPSEHPPAGWRGRQERLLRLESQLRAARDRPLPRQPSASGSGESRSFTHPRKLEPIVNDDSDSRVRQALDRAASDTQTQLREARAALAEAATAKTTAEDRLRAARVRNDVLTRQAGELRADLARLVEKARRDDELILRLRQALAGAGKAEPAAAAAPAFGQDVMESAIPVGVVQAEARQLAAAAAAAEQRHENDLQRIATLEGAIVQLKAAVRAAGLGTREIDAMELFNPGECESCGPELRRLRQRVSELEAGAAAAKQLAADQIAAYEGVCAELARQLQIADSFPAGSPEQILTNQVNELRRRLNEMVVEASINANH